MLVMGKGYLTLIVARELSTLEKDREAMVFLLALYESARTRESLNLDRLVSVPTKLKSFLGQPCRSGILDTYRLHTPEAFEKLKLK